MQHNGMKETTERRKICSEGLKMANIQICTRMSHRHYDLQTDEL